MCTRNKNDRTTSRERFRAVNTSNSSYSSNKQARRHVVKSGPAEVRASAEGTSKGESTRGGIPPLLWGFGGSPPRKFLIYGCLYVRF